MGGRRRRAWLHGGDGKRFRGDQRLPGWVAEWYDRLPDGRRIHRSQTFTTADAARTFVRNFNARIDLRAIGSVVPIPLTEAWGLYAAAAVFLKPATRTSYRVTLTRLVADLGDLQTTEITGRVLDRWFSARAARVREATMAKDLRNLRVFWNWLVRQGHAENNPVAAITTRPRHNIARRRPMLTDADLVGIIGSLDTEDRQVAALIALTTGLDRGVIDRLSVADIDWEARAVIIRRPKTDAVIVAPLHPQLCVWLDQRRREGDASRPLLRGLARQHRERDWWTLACERAGRPGVWFRDLRPVAVARMTRLAGLPLRDAQQLLGHTSIETTAAHYHMPDASSRLLLDRLPLPGWPPGPGSTPA